MFTYCHVPVLVGVAQDHGREGQKWGPFDVNVHINWPTVVKLDSIQGLVDKATYSCQEDQQPNESGSIEKNQRKDRKEDAPYLSAYLGYFFLTL
jgi:hypothetical protein